MARRGKKRGDCITQGRISKKGGCVDTAKLVGETGRGQRCNGKYDWLGGGTQLAIRCGGHGCVPM